jgi:mono/diheme cytochrome c family protein
MEIRRLCKHFLIAAGLAVAAGSVLAFAQAGPATKLKMSTGKEIYESGCIGCHGPAGKGQPQSTTVFERPSTFPDFTRCDQTTPEDNVAWHAVIRDGGPRRGFVQIMPSFGGLLSSKQIDQVVDYLRGFCKDTRWPRGELNLPRALGTEKAFPENEDVITTSINVHGTPGVGNEIAHEQRFGARSQLEIAVPIDFVRPQPGLWYGGLGDIGIGWKQVLAASLRTGSIFSVFGEAVFPVGNRGHELGTGTPAFQTFAAYGQLLPAKTFAQFQAGAELPKNTQKAPQNVFFRTAFGRKFNQSGGAGRLWAPMVEFLADRDLETGARTNWDIMPEFQVTLSRRQHVRANVGVRIPTANTEGRSAQLMFYILWDRADGSLWRGW